MSRLKAVRKLKRKEAHEALEVYLKIADENYSCFLRDKEAVLLVLTLLLLIQRTLTDVC